MQLQWILLALFLIAIVRNVAKAMRNPMLKNFLRLISILVAFIITFILQICGVFQNLAVKIIENFDVASMVPEYEGVIGTAIGLLLPFCTTIISPLLFVLVFLVIFWILQIVHVNLVYRFIVKKKRKQEIREFKNALKEEKMMLKKAITDNEERFKSIVDSINYANPGIDTYDYESLDEDEIDRMVEQRIKLEKSKKKKAGFFKESGERKAISLVCGVVSGFLLFGILWMGMFYSMDVLSNVTDGIDDTNAYDTKIYQMVKMVDDHLVTPYEESFVYKLYDSMAMVDLMNFTVKVGGKIELDDQVYYADDIMRDHMKRAVRLACEITSAKSNQDHIGEDFSAITKDPIMVTILADFLISYVDKVDTESLDSSDPLNSMLASIVNNYKGNKQNIVDDLGAMSDIVVIAAENRLLAKIIADSSNVGALLTDVENREAIQQMAAAMSHLSFYGSTMESMFTLAVDSVGPMLMPANDLEAYEKFVNSIVSSADGITKISDEDLEHFYAFIENAVTFVPSENNTSKGLLAYIIDPLYRAEALKDEGKHLEERVKNLEKAAEDYLNDVNDLKARIEQFYEDIDELTAKLESAAPEIAAIELKKANGEALSEEEQARLDEFYAWQNDKLDFETEADELQAEADALEVRAGELEAEAADIEDQVRQLADNAKTFVTDFENRIKGLTPFINYFMNWTNVHKPFMLANEDGSTACLAINIEGTLYVCSTDVWTIDTLLDFLLNSDSLKDLGNLGGSEGEEGEEGGESDGEDIFDITVNDYLDKIPMKELIEALVVTTDASTMEGRVSDFTDLVNYIILSANTAKSDETEINSEWVYTILDSYCTNENCECIACRIVVAKDPEAEGYVPFVYKGVTTEKMRASMHFGEDEWTLEYREADSKQLVEIIFTLLDLMDTMNGDGESSQVETLLGLLVTIGETMDQMAETHCLKDLPRVMVEGILKNEMLGKVMTPAMLYGEDGYLSRLESGDLTYKALMTEISTIANTVLGKLDDVGGMTQ